MDLEFLSGILDLIFHRTIQMVDMVGSPASQGCLPEQIIAYAMVWLSKERNEKTDYNQFLKKSMKKYFDQSYEWFMENEN